MNADSPLAGAGFPPKRADTTLTDADNPLLDFSGLPRFDRIEACHLEPAIETLLGKARASVAAVTADRAEANWERVVAPTETALDELDRAFAIAGHLNAVASTKSVRAAYNAVLPRVTAFDAELAQNRPLHVRYRALADGRAMSRLTPAQQRVVLHALRDFRLGGADLEPPRQARLKAVCEELAMLSARFDDNVLDAQDEWSLVIADESLLFGIPDDVKAAARDAARGAGVAGWKLTLRAPCYQPVMRHADDRGLRARMYRAAVTIASELGDSTQHDNTEVLVRILALRQEEARLLGYASYAGLSLETKMAASPAEVLAFLRDLARRVRPFAQREYAELRTYARETLGIVDFAAWDVAWVSEKLRQKRYAFSEEDLRAWLPLDRVLAGLFRVAETLYGIEIREERASAWHPSVRFYAIRARDGTPCGQFYLDLYAREGKQGGAWMDDAMNRRRTGTRVQHPVAWLTCNFPSPVAGAMPHLTHRQVITLFHEFGHALHLLLTTIDIAGISGLQEVEWDAIELPSQLMENFCWDRGVLESMTAHTVTGMPLPSELFDRMLAARNFGTGMVLAHQLELAVLDMLLHGGDGSFHVPEANTTAGAPRGTPTDGPTGTPDERSAARAANARNALASTTALLDAVRAEVAVEPYPDWDRSLHQFGHIFAGDYAAGYYSYLWAEVMSADAFSLFEEAGVLSPAIGARFRDEFLALGGTRPALESFVAFRGRPPQLDALLRHNGLVEA